MLAERKGRFIRKATEEPSHRSWDRWNTEERIALLSSVLLEMAASKGVWEHLAVLGSAPALGECDWEGEQGDLGCFLFSLSVSSPSLSGAVPDSLHHSTEVRVSIFLQGAEDGEAVLSPFSLQELN